ncbi:uncharacterized protein RHTO_00440 [Rhodotorula toruloides NP11]|uniref:Uncharacterized protein n=1 Tax=Rhodotorula toruloides (strain NP11) TaxID=1130832 RepID=M7WZD6_RHOT1|nr:uncharacterized protein RHTO_00440 [Rhodotorula toruloides NP11]EMS26012.1 hypothetical protein RHTO_00440 [Rhodotorula toruloides NP11]
MPRCRPSRTAPCLRADLQRWSGLRRFSRDSRAACWASKSLRIAGREPRLPRHDRRRRQPWPGCRATSPEFRRRDSPDIGFCRTLARLLRPARRLKPVTAAREGDRGSRLHLGHTSLLGIAIRFALPRRKLAQTCSCLPFDALPVLTTTKSRRSPSACEILYDLDNNSPRTPASHPPSNTTSFARGLTQ